MIPQILVVDDEPERVESSLGIEVAQKGANPIIRHPQAVTLDDLANCTVVVVDHYLDDWPERDDQPLAMQPADGFAVAAVIRSQLPVNRPGPAVAILTGRLAELAGTIPPKAAEYLLAWQHDLEWVFSKGSEVTLAPRLIAMSMAVAKLREMWPRPLELDDLAADWLDLQDVEWQAVALEHVLLTSPPMHAVSVRTTGASVLRWFLHRVLPYPTFLTDIFWTATRLGVTAEWLEEELQTDNGLRAQLSGCQYSGAFAGFSGRRWWRAGLANLIAELSEGQPFDRTALQDGIRRVASTEPSFLAEERPVLAVDPDTMESTRIVEVDLATRIIPDGWPVYADDAWASVADAQDNPEIKDMVLDQSRLEASG